MSDNSDNIATVDAGKYKKNITDVQLLTDEVYGRLTVGSKFSAKFPYQAISYVRYKDSKRNIDTEDKNIYSQFDLVEINGARWAFAYGNTSWSDPDMPFLIDIAAVKVLTTSDYETDIVSEVHRALCYNHNFLSSLIVACEGNVLWFNGSSVFSPKIAEFFEKELQKYTILLPSGEIWRTEYRADLPEVLSDLFISILSERS